jgi:hypothetical protein
VDASVLLLSERRQSENHIPEVALAEQDAQEPTGWRAAEQPSLFQLYCAPRKALFEEALWSSAEAAANSNGGKRERLELHEGGVSFVAPARSKPCSQDQMRAGKGGNEK